MAPGVRILRPELIEGGREVHSPPEAAPRALTGAGAVPTASILDLRLGRLYLPTLFNEVQEAVGDALARRRPRQFSLTIPIHSGYGDPTPYTTGLRMRRQMRAMMENSTYRLQGIYFSLQFDSELNGWTVAGSGQIKYAQGGVTFA